MEIKKVPGGWEYKGVIYADKEDALLVFAGERNSSEPVESLPENSKLELVWDPDMGKSCLRYFVALYLAERGNDLQSMQREFNELAPKIGLR